MSNTTKLHLFELFLLGFNEARDATPEQMLDMMEYGMHGGCYDIYPKIGKAMTVDVGEWEDDHPLNQCDTPLSYYYSLFGKDYNTLLEALAELEHDQWCHCTRGIVEDGEVNLETTERWRKYWIPYAELSEDDKEKDRVWARKVLEALGITP